MTTIGKKPPQADASPGWFSVVLEALPSSLARTVAVVAMALAVKGYQSEISQFFVWMVKNHKIQISTFAFVAVVALYLFRRWSKPAYGTLEIALSVIALLVFISKEPTNPSEWIAGFAAPIYIAIRGLVNIYGEPGPNHLPKR
jgi:hypothetical protein